MSPTVSIIARMACIVADCVNPVYIKKRQLCGIHYSRFKRHGDPEAEVRSYTHGGGSCTICGKRTMGRGLCPNHYKQWQYRQNPDKYRAWETARREREPERIRAADRERYRRTPESRQRVVRIAKARRAGAPGHASRAQVEARFAFWGHRCWICGGPPETIDHVIPISRGGSNWPSNLRPACKACNSRKGAKIVHRAS